MGEAQGVEKEVINNCIRSYLKEVDITHLDAIICLVQSHNILLDAIDKKIGKIETIQIMKTITGDDSEILVLACNLSLHISELVEKIRRR